VSVGEYVDGRSDGGGDLITAAGAASPTAKCVKWRPQVNGCQVIPVNRHAMTRRYKSSCRVNRWRSDADGVRLLDLSKSEATLDLSAMLQLQLLEESATCLGTGSATASLVGSTPEVAEFAKRRRTRSRIRSCI
jgi:hypothetical protein